MILSERRQAIQNDIRIIPTLANTENTIGILNVHFTMPSELKNSDKSGLIARQLITNPATVEIIIAGINDSAVCTMSCFVVNPSDFKIP